MLFMFQEEKDKLHEAIQNGDVPAIRSMITENLININANISSKVVSDNGCGV